MGCSLEPPRPRIRACCIDTAQLCAGRYNYNTDVYNTAQLDFVNRNQLEFVAMYNGGARARPAPAVRCSRTLLSAAYLQLQRKTHVAGWPLPTGADERCFFWESALPTNPNNQYYGSALCTADDLVRVLNASNQVLHAPVKRLALFNEGWGLYPQNTTEAATWYKAVLEEVVARTGVRLISPTDKHGSEGLAWTGAFYRACADRGCNLLLIDEFAVHRYNTK